MSDHRLTIHTKRSQNVPPAGKPDAPIGEWVPGEGAELYRCTCSCGWEQVTWRNHPGRAAAMAVELHTGAVVA